MAMPVARKLLYIRLINTNCLIFNIMIAIDCGFKFAIGEITA